MKRLSYDLVTGRRVMKLWPSSLRGYAAGMRNRSECCLHSDRRAVKDEAQKALHPTNGAVGEGLNTSPWQRIPLG